MKAAIALIAVLFFLHFANPALAAGFTLSSTQTSINAGDELNVDVYFSINATNGTTYYLRGVFYPAANNYCGYTWNGNSWYNGPYTVNNGWQQLLAVTVNQSSWSGQLKAKIDPSDDNCQNSGNYYFKIKRYTGNGSSGSFDDQNSLSLSVSIPTPTPSSVPTDTPTPTATVVSTSTSSPTGTPIPTLAPGSTSTPILKPSLIPSQGEIILADILGESTESGGIALPTKTTDSAEDILISGENEKPNSNIQGIFITIGGLFLIACAILFFRRRAKTL